jgi:(S)-ureidoglycine aminohydrolase
MHTALQLVKNRKISGNCFSISAILIEPFHFKLRIKLALVIVASLVVKSINAQQSAPPADSLIAKVYAWTDLVLKKEGDDFKRSIFSGSTTTLRELDVAAYTLPPGQAIPPTFQHDDLEELMIIKEGSCKITIEGNTKIMGCGSIAFVMPGDKHAISNAGNGDAIYYILKYQGKKPDHERGKSAGGSFFVDWKSLPTSTTGKGYRRDFFNRATSQLAQFEMHSTALNADSASHAPHTHTQEEIVLILRGDVTMHINGDLFPATVGDLVFLPSGVPHALVNSGKQQCEYFAFQWKN